MKRIIYNKFDKGAISGLPIAAFPGKITVVLSESEAEKAVDYLLSCSILGVDTETRPAFKRGQQHKVSLLQVSSYEHCFLFRLNYLGMSPSVIRLLTNKNVTMVGLSWHDDLMALHRRQDFEAGNFVDIQNIIGKIGIEDMSLQKLYANIFHKKISKRQRLTNWDADILTDKQKLYAATDAWACIMLYDEIKKLSEGGDYQLVMKEEKPVEGAQAENSMPVVAQAQ